MIGIIDYNAGNVASVKNALNRISAKFFVSNNPTELQKADKIIFPGVGNAKSAMENLRTNNLFNFIKDYQKPFLGICLGMQLLFQYSEEGETECLGIIKGKVEKFNFPKNKKVIVPHMGWNEIMHSSEELFKNIPQNINFYFVHSYFCNPTNKKEIIAKTNYEDNNFCSAIKKDNFYGVQFHPEKSGKIGQKILKNFVNIKI